MLYLVRQRTELKPSRPSAPGKTRGNRKFGPLWRLGVGQQVGHGRNVLPKGLHGHVGLLAGAHLVGKDEDREGFRPKSVLSPWISGERARANERRVARRHLPCINNRPRKVFLELPKMRQPFSGSKAAGFPDTGQQDVPRLLLSAFL